ncbi:hypothetical protein SS50377_22411 [Spironucleus salmonicida]|uniref:HMG box domain-containing protein n=1 Tax=Spironucleus salmonicida TaxID=348837 RepID=V6LC61_9EUKA|nr:hypothetical protein SS50377_22411 [Spironucleus salmonicida]|eukprot:EST42095.1 hypothetical protein SS50377_18404 [Spironucleus salmonicida]
MDQKPKKPFSAYFQWAEDRKKTLMNMEFKARQQKLGAEWKVMSEKERTIWKRKANEDSQIYERQLSAWYARHPEQKVDEEFNRQRHEFTRIFFMVCYAIRVIELGSDIKMDARQGEILLREWSKLSDGDKQEWYSFASICEQREEEKAEVLKIWNAMQI